MSYNVASDFHRWKPESLAVLKLQAFEKMLSEKKNNIDVRGSQSKNFSLQHSDSSTHLNCKQFCKFISLLLGAYRANRIANKGEEYYNKSKKTRSSLSWNVPLSLFRSDLNPAWQFWEDTALRSSDNAVFVFQSWVGHHSATSVL